MLHVLALAPCLGWMSVLLGEGPAIAVEPPNLTGRAVENQELFQREIDQAVSAHGELADPSNATYRVRVQVEEDARDYVIHLELLDASGTSVAQADSGCDICSESEAAGQTGRDLAALLAANLQVTTSARFTTEPAGATVVLDGTAIGKTPIATSLDPGPHTVAFERDGYESSSREFEAESGKKSELHVDLVGGEAPRQPRPGKNLKGAAWIGGWIGIGVGVALVTTGIALLAIDEREIKNDCGGANKDVFGNCRYRYKTIGGGAAATALGLALAGTGVGFVVWSRPNRGKQELRANVGPTRVAFTLRF